MIPYDEIIERGDRRWTMRLLDRLQADGVDAAELFLLGNALRVLADPRSFEPLEDIIADTTRPDEIRRTASWAIRMHRTSEPRT